MKKRLILLAWLGVLTLTCIHPIYPKEMFLQHSASLVVAAWLTVDCRRQVLSNFSFGLVVLFMIFHAIGARYIYSYVPYAEWFGWDVQPERNHYDRFVHFAFGLLLFEPARQIWVKGFRHPVRGSAFVAWLLLATGSLAYEVIEWGLTLVLSPQQAENYNGQQGDFWDAQKDMALAMAGGSIAWLASHFLRRLVTI